MTESGAARKDRKVSVAGFNVAVLFVSFEFQTYEACKPPESRIQE